MAVQQFCLRWNNHQPNFISVFTSLLNTETLVDVTLAAEGKHLQAHKVVLSACSVYFQSLFTANPSRHPIVILKDVKHSDLKILVNFMYHGEVQVSQEQLPQILETAKMLKIKGLTEMPEPAGSSGNAATAERATLHPPAAWHSDIQRHTASPCNLSPSVRRKRQRKSSAGSRPSSTERVMENPCAGAVRPVNTNSEPVSQSSAPSTSQFSNKGRGVNKEQQMPDYSSKDSFDETPNMDPNLTLNAEEDRSDCNLIPDDHPLEESSGPSSQEGSWPLMENYHRYSGPTNNVHGIHPMNMNQMHPQEMHPFGMQAMINSYDYQSPPQVQSHSEEMDGDSPGPSNLQAAPNLEQSTVAPIQKRRRTTNPQSEENFQRALEAVRFGGIGFCKAARMFGVNNRTLWLEYKKKGYPNTRPSIKNRIKQEHSSPPPESREEAPATSDQQLTLLCPPHPVGMMSFIDSRHVDFSMSRPRFSEENINLHGPPLNLQGINFNSM